MMRRNKWFDLAQSDERGNVLILVAFFMVVILGMAVIAIDVGSLYQNRRQVVNAADAAALAGAQEIVRAQQDGVTSDSEVQKKVRKVVVDYLGYHGAELIDVTEQDGSPIGANSKTVKVTADKEASLFFAPAFSALAGSNLAGSSDVGAAATAKLNPVYMPKILAPFSIHENVWPFIDGEFILTMKFKPGQGQGQGQGGEPEPGDEDYVPWGDGNWGPVNFEGPGSNMDKLVSWIKDGYEGEVSAGSTIWAAPSTGLSNNNALNAINDHIDNETILIVPVISGEPSGTGEIFIEGFSSIKLIKPYPQPGANMEIKAQIINKNYTVDLSDGEAKDFGLESARLIE